MPIAVTAFKANDGSLHEDACTAATRDVELMVQRSPLSENQPYAKKLVEWLTQNSRDIRAVLETHERACPRNSEDTMPLEAGEGPVVEPTEIEPSATEMRHAE